MASDVDDKKGFSTITARPFQEQGVARDDRCRSTQIADKKKPLLLAAFFVSGSTTWTRTRDPMINSHLLYQLSYRGMASILLI